MKNKHIGHAEDLLFSEADLLAPLHLLEDTFLFLCGWNDPTVKVSVKWDGSPAFVCGLEPETKQFVLGTKSIFAKKPIIAWSIDDIAVNYPDEGLVYKMRHIFNNLCSLKWDGLYQGDMLWTAGNSLFDIDDDTVFYFKPNTLKYRFPVSKFANLGAVLHTTYIGNTLQSMESSSGCQDPDHDKDVYLFEPSIKPENVLSVPDKEQFLEKLDILRKNAYNINYHYQEYLKYFQDHPNFLEKLNKYINRSITGYYGSQIPNAYHFLDFLQEEYKVHYGLLSSEKGKKLFQQKHNEMLDWYDVFMLTSLFNHYNELVKLKTTLIRKLDSFTLDDNPITLPNGNITGHEGYVVESDNVYCKLVDRYGFSKQNMLYPKEWK